MRSMGTQMKRRQSDGTRLTPPSLDAVFHCFTGFGIQSNPFLQRCCPSIYGQLPRHSSVAHLFAMRRPSYISNLVMPLIVDSVKRVLWSWSRPNMFKKLGKRFKMKLDTSLAVIHIRSLFRIVTSRFSPLKCSIFNRVVKGQSTPPSAYHFASQASTRLAAFVYQIVTPYFTNSATNTLAEPFIITTICKYRPTVKDRAGQVLNVRKWCGVNISY